MLWFEYKYLTSSEILSKIVNIIDYSIIDIIILVIWIAFIIILTFYLFPLINIYNKEKQKLKEKKIKKEMLRKIVLQKEINESIAKELDIKKD